ncbi:MAG: RNA polymerase sigma-70 factor (ECF subfamily) [Candidatus Latescibacterota bacterium]|jgi:RNA polymerase sigma-70 factor (ECF subfamily)
MALSSEIQLVNEAQSGDLEAFDALYKTHHPQIYHTVLSRAHPDDVDDLVQVTFLRAFECLALFRGESAFSTWLTRIAMNACHTQWRTRAQQQARYVSVDVTESAADLELPDMGLQRAEFEALVRDVIAHLPEKYRRAIWLHYVLDHSYEDITKILKVPIGTVKTWLNRGRLELKQRLKRVGIYGYELA